MVWLPPHETDVTGSGMLTSLKLTIQWNRLIVIGAAGWAKENISD